MTSYLGEILALTTAVCWSLTAVFFSYSGRQIGSDAVNRTRLLLALVFISLTHWLLQGTPFPLHVEAFRWGWLALSSILGLVIGDAALFEAYVLVGPRLGTLMMATVPVISTLLAWLFLGERVTGQELLGILITVGGIAWVVTEKRVNSNQSSVNSQREQSHATDYENLRQSASTAPYYRRGLLFGLLGALGQSTNLIAAKSALVDNFPTISALHIRILVAAVMVWVMAAGQGKVGRIVSQWRNRKAFWAILGGSLVGPFLGIWFSLMAIQLTRVGIASTLMALPPVILIPLGYLLYRERVSRRGLVGTLVAFGGVAVLFLS